MNIHHSDYVSILHEIQTFLNTFATKSHLPVLIAIDGMSGSGKTTFTSIVSELYDCNVFHMDHFFLRPEQRTKERFSEFGGNVDYERFYSEVLQPLKKGIAFSYQKYNCKTEQMSDTVYITPKPINFIEGAYSTHPYYGNPYDLMLFFDIDSEIQKERILARNGKMMYERFLSEWIPMENAYFDAFSIREKCKCFRL